MINRFILNEVSYFGPGARKVLPKEISRLGLRKAFVATDKDLIKYGVADKVLSVLEAAGIPYEIFSEIKQNPTVFNVKAGVKAFAESGADFILAIGGGSSIDTAKAIGIITNNPEFGDVVSLEGADELQIVRIMAAQIISFAFVLAIYVYKSRKKRVNRNVFN